MEHTNLFCTFPFYLQSRNSSVGIDTRLHAGQQKNRGSITGYSKTLTCSKNRLHGSPAHPASFSMNTAIFSPGRSGLCRKLTAKSINDKFKIRWSYNSILPYISMACRGTRLFFPPVQSPTSNLHSPFSPYYCR
jgi:hypothetical protein